MIRPHGFRTGVMHCSGIRSRQLLCEERRGEKGISCELDHLGHLARLLLGARQPRHGSKEGSLCCPIHGQGRRQYRLNRAPQWIIPRVQSVESYGLVMARWAASLCGRCASWESACRVEARGYHLCGVLTLAQAGELAV